jgi:hypothetical protein
MLYGIPNVSLRCVSRTKKDQYVTKTTMEYKVVVVQKTVVEEDMVETQFKVSVTKQT